MRYILDSISKEALVECIHNVSKQFYLSILYFLYSWVLLFAVETRNFAVVIDVRIQRLIVFITICASKIFQIFNQIGHYSSPSGWHSKQINPTPNFNTSVRLRHLKHLIPCVTCFSFSITCPPYLIAFHILRMFCEQSIYS